MKRIGLLLLLVVLASGSVWAATINVPANHATIQAAIDAAVDGDTVLVALECVVYSHDFLKSNYIFFKSCQSNVYYSYFKSIIY